MPPSGLLQPPAPGGFSVLVRFLATGARGESRRKDASKNLEDPGSRRLASR